MAKKEPIPERKNYVTIRSGMGKPMKFETKQYYGIALELTLRSADRDEARRAARWCFNYAKPGDRRELWPDITMEVTEE